MRATRPFGGAHLLLALRLDHKQLERIGGGADPHMVLGHLEFAGLEPMRRRLVVGACHNSL